MSNKIENNFTYYVNYDVVGENSCEDYGCHEEGICRCYHIHDVEFISVDLDSIVSRIFNSYYNPQDISYIREEKMNQVLYNYDRELDIYCIDRILRINKVWNKNNWRFDWGGSYYGDEVNKAFIEEEVFNSILCDIYKINNLKTIQEKISYLLKREYGYLLPELSEKNWKISNIKKEDIFFPQKEHLKNLKREKKGNFLSQTIIKGVCMRDRDKLRVIDGYHRLFFNEQRYYKIIEIYD
jgi:hypothetical protein